MPAISTTKYGLENLIANFRRDSKNYTKISAETLSNNPRYILLLRLNLSMSQPQFEKFLGISKNVHKYESGKVKKMQIRTAENFLAKLGNIRISENRIRDNFKKSEQESKGWFKANALSEKASKARQLGAQRSLAKRFSTQEKEVADFLKNKGIECKINYPINNKSIVDIYIKKFNIGIQCKRLHTINRRKQTERIRELAYQGYKTKFLNNKIKLIAVIETELPLQHSDYEELKGPYDYICTKVHELKNIF